VGILHRDGEWRLSTEAIRDLVAAANQAKQLAAALEELRVLATNGEWADGERQYRHAVDIIAAALAEAAPQCAEMEE